MGNILQICIVRGMDQNTCSVSGIGKLWPSFPVSPYRFLVAKKKMQFLVWYGKANTVLWKRDGSMQTAP